MKQDIRENLALALDTLRSHPMRSFLTVLGIVIGVAVPITVVALMAGFDQNIQEAISGFGADTIGISQFDMVRMGRMSREERMRKPLTAEDGDAIKELCPAVVSVATSIFPDRGPQGVRFKDKEVVGIEFRGTFPTFIDVYANAAMKQGRFFNEGENRSRQKVAVIGENIADALFPMLDPIDKEILLDGSTFRVVGVFEKPKGGFGGNDEDRRVIVPYQTVTKIWPLADRHFIRAQAKPGQLDVAMDQIRDVLRRRRNVKYSEPDSFSMQTSQQVIDQFHAIVGAVALVTLVISSIGLLVGGVGVMNIMLVSVTERTREIGVRKAIGARRRDINSQFLMEAMALTGVGGILGILLGAIAANGVRLGTGWAAAVPMWIVVVAISVSVFVGLAFGVWPAAKASRLDPVEALRYE